MFLDNDSYLFNCTIELIEADGPAVVNIEELEAFSEVTLFSLRLRTFLSDLGPQFCLETINYQWRSMTYFLISLFIFK
jgi:hypothetical protein